MNFATRLLVQPRREWSRKTDSATTNEYEAMLTDAAQVPPLILRSELAILSVKKASHKDALGRALESETNANQALEGRSSVR